MLPLRARDTYAGSRATALSSTPRTAAASSHIASTPAGPVFRGSTAPSAGSLCIKLPMAPGHPQALLPDVGRPEVRSDRSVGGLPWPSFFEWAAAYSAAKGIPGSSGS